MTAIVDRNIDALVKRRRTDHENTAPQDRIADTVTRFAGSMYFVYFHLVVFGAWVVVNLGWIPGVRPFDETFVTLAMVASVEAIFLSAFVLVSQNRMALQADQRADLDLQISLLSEHEITRLVVLVTGIAKRLDLPEAHDPELGELARDVAPEEVLDRIRDTERKVEGP